MANATGLFKASNGLRANYDLLASKDANIMYVCHGDQNYKHGIYVGSERVAVDGKLENLTGANTGQVVINIDGDTATVYNTTAINNMISSIISGITWKGDISVANLKLVTGYKVGWLYRINSTTGNPWTTNVDLEVGDYILCISDYNSAFAATDFVVWERNLTGAITCVNGINGWTDGTFNPICAFGGTGGSKATEVAKPLNNTDNLFLKYIDDADPTSPTAQLPVWSTAVEPDGYPSSKLTNHALIVGRGEAKVAAIAPPAAKGYILLSSYNNGAMDPQWLAGEGSSHDGYVLTWNSTTQLPEWRVNTGGGSTPVPVSDGNDIGVISNDDNGYVLHEEYDLVADPQRQTPLNTKHVNVFNGINNNESLIIYNPTENSANGELGKTWGMDLPSSDGILFFNARIYTNPTSDPSVSVRNEVTSLNPSHTSLSDNGIPIESAIVNALLWGQF